MIDFVIFVYDKKSKKDDVLNTNGITILKEIVEAYIEENINGDFTFTFTGLTDDLKLEYLEKDAIVKVNYNESYEVFRIFKSRKIFDRTEFICRHITYDLEDNFLEDIRPTNLNADAAIKYIGARTQVPTEFEFSSDITTVNTAYYIRKNFLDAIWGNEDESFLNRWGGEVKRQQYKFSIVKRLGVDTSNYNLIAYAKNIISMEEVSSGDEVTRIMPLARNGQDVVMLPEKYIDSPIVSKYPFPRIRVQDFNDLDVSKSDLQTVHAQMKDRVKKLFENNIDKPDVTLKIDIYHEENAKWSLGDVCKVYSTKLRLDLMMRLTKVKWDCIKMRFISLELNSRLGGI